MKRIRQRSFIVVTIVILVLVILGACVPTALAYFTSTSNSQTKLVVANSAGAVAGMSDDKLARYINAALNGTASGIPGSQTPGEPAYAISMAPTGSSAGSLEQQVKGGAISILLMFDRGPNGDLRFT
jgi:hypothetical protein